MIIMQGDQYGIPVQIETESGIANSGTFADVEIVVGSFVKSLLAKEQEKKLSYDSEAQAFLFPITQEESFAMRNVIQPVQVRVKTGSGEVIGIPLGDINIVESASKEVL